MYKYNHFHIFFFFLISNITYWLRKMQYRQQTRISFFFQIKKLTASLPIVLCHIMYTCWTPYSDCVNKCVYKKNKIERGIHKQCHNTTWYFLLVLVYFNKDSGPDFNRTINSNSRTSWSLSLEPYENHLVALFVSSVQTYPSSNEMKWVFSLLV